jgi:small redox-active disulfide protein 2
MVMKKLEVLGTGCAKCDKLAELTEQAARELGLEYELVKVTDIMAITERGVIMTPGLVVDGVVKVTGKLPTLDEIKGMIG